MPVELTTPVGLWLGALALPLVLLYVLGSRRRRVTVPSLLHFRGARRDLQAKNPFRRLVPEVPLLLELAFVLLCALALAGPRSRLARVGGESVALVVDISASMNARPPGGASRFDEALGAARSILDGLGPGQHAMIIAAGESPEVAASFEIERSRLEAALDALSVHDTPGDLNAALALAVERIEVRGLPGRVLVLTDGKLPDLPRVDVPIEVRPIGEPLDNVGIVRASIDRDDGSALRGRVRAHLTVQSFSREPAERYITLRREGSVQPVASRRIDLAPGQKHTVTLSFEPASTEAGTGIVAELSDRDALETDDRAYLVIPPAPELPVVVAPDSGPSWVSRALEADPHVRLVSGRAPPGALSVYLGVCPTVLPPGDLLVIAPPPGTCLDAVVDEAPGDARVTSWDRHDPRLRFVDLEGLVAPGARALADVPADDLLVVAGKTPLVARLDRSGRHRTIVSFDVEASRWPGTASFVVFVRNVAELARQTARHLAGDTVTSGKPTAIAVPEGARDLVVEEADGAEVELPIHRGLAIAPPPRSVGFRFAHWGGPAPGSKRIGVTLASPDESDLGLRGATTGQSEAPGRIAHLEALVRLGGPLALVALAALLAELAWLGRGRPFPSLTQLVARRTLAVFTAVALLLGVAAALSSWAVAPRAWLPLRFDHPAAALLAPLLMLLVGMLLLRFTHRWQPWKRRATEVLVSLAALSAVLAAAAPEVGLRLERLAILIAVDRSRSMDLVDGAASRAEAELRLAETGMGDDDRVGIVVFGSEARVEEPLRPRTELPAPQRVEVARDGTSLEAAIRRALAEVPSGTAARIALLSDGVENRGHALDAAAAARVAAVPIDVVPLDQRPVQSVRVVDVRAPSRSAMDEPVEIKVVTDSPAEADLEVRLYRDGRLIRSGAASVAEGQDVLWLRDRPPGAGLHRYDVQVTAADASLDQVADDNRGTTFTQVHGPERALVLASSAASAQPIVDALGASGIEMTVATAIDAPEDAVGLAAYDLVVLLDVPASQLDPVRLDALATYVQDGGGGLLLLGSPATLGPGGYSQSPIETISPVSFDLKQDRRRGSLSEVIAIDFSGSMGADAGGHTKLELAGDAAVRSASLLGKGDRVGILHVDTEAHWTVALSEPERERIERAVRDVAPGGGGIYVDTALDAAYRALAAERTNLKHVLLFSDGDDAESMARAPAFAKAAAARGVTTSVVALGRGKDTAALEHLSRIGGGRFYLIEHAGRLPAVFAQETIAATRSAVSEISFVPELASGARYLEGIDTSGSPPLGGYVVTIEKARADVALRGPEGDPVLATWSAGLGRVGVFTSSFGPPWSTAWTRWAEASQLFSQLARHLARSLGDGGITLDVHASGGELHVQAVDHREPGGAPSALDVVVGGPDGIRARAALEPSAEGIYGGDLSVPKAGAYLVTVVDRVTGRPLATTAAELARADELRPTGTDRKTLERIAALSGGEVRDTLAGVFGQRASRRLAYRPALPWLIGLAACALVGAVAVRRLSVPDFIAPLPAGARRLWAHATRRRAARTSPRPDDRPNTLPPGTTALPDPSAQDPSNAPEEASDEGVNAIEKLAQRRRRKRS